MPKDDSKPRKDKKDKKEKKEKKSKKVIIEEEVVVPAPSPSPSSEPTPDVVVAPATSEPVASSSSASSDSSDDETDVPKREQVDDGTLLEIDPDAPAPLSRAALRKAKSNPALAAAASTEEATSSTKGKEKAAAGTATDNKPGKYSVWVGNLAFRTTEAELREYFRPALTLSARKGKGKATTTEDGAEDEDKDEELSSASSSSSDEESDAEDKEEEGGKKAPPQPTVTRVNLPRTKTQGNRPGVNKGYVLARFFLQDGGRRDSDTRTPLALHTVLRFAYVDFSNWASQQAAVKLSEGHLRAFKHADRQLFHELSSNADLPSRALSLTTSLTADGRALLIKAATDFTNRPEAPKAALASLPEGQTKSKSAQALLAKQRNPVGPTLFVGNLGFEATEEGLRSLIAAHWETSLSNAKRHAQKAPRSNFLPESETTEGDGADKKEGEAVEGGEKEDEDKGGEEAVVGLAAGIRKVRMAQFQDSGKCKGCVFSLPRPPSLDLLLCSLATDHSPRPRFSLQFRVPRLLHAGSGYGCADRHAKPSHGRSTAQD